MELSRLWLFHHHDDRQAVNKIHHCVVRKPLIGYSNPKVRFTVFVFSDMGFDSVFFGQVFTSSQKNLSRCLWWRLLLILFGKILTGEKETISRNFFERQAPSLASCFEGLAPAEVVFRGLFFFFLFNHPATLFCDHKTAEKLNSCLLVNCS